MNVHLNVCSNLDMTRPSLYIRPNVPTGMSEREYSSWELC